MWNLDTLPYGWKIAAGAIVAGAGIYIASNTRQRVNQVDVVQLALGVTERCYAARLTPPTFARAWYSNTYTQVAVTNGSGTNATVVTNWVAVCWTNTLTNTIGWRTDHKLFAQWIGYNNNTRSDLDSKLKQCVPLYVDYYTNDAVTCRVVMLTVTGLWARLGIGDRTNQFTSVPAWVATNGVTNAATYGDMPGRMYVQDFQERYKVLWALTQTVANLSWTGMVVRQVAGWGFFSSPEYYAGDYTTLINPAWSSWPQSPSRSGRAHSAWAEGGAPDWWATEPISATYTLALLLDHLGTNAPYVPTTTYSRPYITCTLLEFPNTQISEGYYEPGVTYKHYHYIAAGIDEWSISASWNSYYNLYIATGYLAAQVPDLETGVTYQVFASESFFYYDMSLSAYTNGPRQTINISPKDLHGSLTGKVYASSGFYDASALATNSFTYTYSSSNSFTSGDPETSITTWHSGVPSGNSRLTESIIIYPPIGVVQWQFLYCTNKFW